MNIMHPFYQQHLKQLNLVLKESLRPSITSDLLVATLEQLRLESGLPCLDGDWQIDLSCAWLTNCWLKDLLTFCGNKDITIQDTCPTLRPYTTGDVFLMQVFASFYSDPSELRRLNEGHMFLQVISLSDICTADLKTILFDAYHGKLLSRTRSAVWPRRPPHLPKSSWDLWQQALTNCFIIPGSPHRSLHVSLGQWLPVASIEWQWYYSPQESCIYQRTGPFFNQFS